MNQNVVIAALYKFVRLDDFEELQPEYLQFCLDHDVKGTDQGKYIDQN